MKLRFKGIIACAITLAGIATLGAVDYSPQNVSATLALKVPGNPADVHELTLQKLNNSYFDYECVASEKLPVTVFQQVKDKDGKKRITVFITAMKDISFNYGQQLKTGYAHKDCQFYLPGFWYRRNLRSPKEAPSFHTSDSWTVREDRLSTPLTSIYNEKSGGYMTVTRIDKFRDEALTTHKEGEVILSGKTSLGSDSKMYPALHLFLSAFLIKKLLRLISVSSL